MFGWSISFLFMELYATVAVPVTGILQKNHLYLSKAMVSF